MAFGDFQVLTSWALPQERFAEAASTTRLTDSTVANDKIARSNACAAIAVVGGRGADDGSVAPHITRVGPRVGSG